VGGRARFAACGLPFAGRGEETGCVCLDCAWTAGRLPKGIASVCCAGPRPVCSPRAGLSRDARCNDPNRCQMVLVLLPSKGKVRSIRDGVRAPQPASRPAPLAPSSRPPGCAARLPRQCLPSRPPAPAPVWPRPHPPGHVPGGQAGRRQRVLRADAVLRGCKGRRGAQQPAAKGPHAGGWRALPLVCARARTDSVAP
jgi:hypothetical protein